MKTAQRSKPSCVFSAAGKGLLSLTVFDGQLSSILLLCSFWDPGDFVNRKSKSLPQFLNGCINSQFH